MRTLFGDVVISYWLSVFIIKHLQRQPGRFDTMYKVKTMADRITVKFGMTHVYLPLRFFDE